MFDETIHSSLEELISERKWWEVVVGREPVLCALNFNHVYCDFITTQSVCQWIDRTVQSLTDSSVGLCVCRREWLTEWPTELDCCTVVGIRCNISRMCARISHSLFIGEIYLPFKSTLIIKCNFNFTQNFYEIEISVEWMNKRFFLDSYLNWC